MGNSRDKQIDGMAKVIGDADQRCYEIEDCDDCPFHCMELGLCKEKFIADALYNAGYRKSTVLAEEIFEEIDTLMVRSMIAYTPFIDDRLIRDITKLRKKYIGKDTNITTNNEIVKCPCCKREVRQAKMMCSIKMCADCFRTKEKKYTESEKDNG